MADGEFRMVPIAELVDSKTNPRRHVSERGAKELLESIRERGVLVPLLVRPILAKGKGHPAKDGRHDHLEVVAGTRRLKAARTLGLTELPVRVMELSDEDALEIQTIENLQREDVHPLDEAQGYRALMATGRYDVEGLAAKVGKSASYIYQRLKLNDLIAPAQKAFWDEKIMAGHAILLARLNPGDQKEALQTSARGEGVWSVRQLDDWIQRTLFLRLGKAPFDAEDAELLPKLGPCSTCPKRSGANPQLFPDIRDKDTCSDSACYDRKVEAHIARQTEAYKKRGEELVRVQHGYLPYGEKVPTGTLTSAQYSVVEKGQPCDRPKAAIVVAGQDIGGIISICRDKTCKVHYVRGGSPRSSEERARTQKENEKRRQRAQIYQRAMAQVVETFKAFGPPEWRLLGQAVCYRTDFDHAKILCAILGLEVPKSQYGSKEYDKALAEHVGSLAGAGLQRTILHIAAMQWFPTVYWSDTKRFDDLAAERGVDLKKIAKEVAAEAAAAQKKRADRAAKKTARAAGKKPAKVAPKVASGKRKQRSSST